MSGFALSLLWLWGVWFILRGGIVLRKAVTHSLSSSLSFVRARAAPSFPRTVYLTL